MSSCKKIPEKKNLFAISRRVWNSLNFLKYLDFKDTDSLLWRQMAWLKSPLSHSSHLVSVEDTFHLPECKTHSRTVLFDCERARKAAAAVDWKLEVDHLRRNFDLGVIYATYTTCTSVTQTRQASLLAQLMAFTLMLSLFRVSWLVMSFVGTK